MTIKELGTLAQTTATYDPNTGEELTAAVYYTDPETDEPWYHVDTTEQLDVSEVHVVAPPPGAHKFAGVETYHYRFKSQAEFYALVPEAVIYENELLL